MEALILLSRRVHRVEMQRTYALPDAGCVYARTHALSPHAAAFASAKAFSREPIECIPDPAFTLSLLDNRLIVGPQQFIFIYFSPVLL